MSSCRHSTTSQSRDLSHHHVLLALTPKVENELDLVLFLLVHAERYLPTMLASLLSIRDPTAMTLDSVQQRLGVPHKGPRGLIPLLMVSFGPSGYPDMLL